MTLRNPKPARSEWFAQFCKSLLGGDQDAVVHEYRPNSADACCRLLCYTLSVKEVVPQPAEDDICGITRCQRRILPIVGAWQHECSGRNVPLARDTFHTAGAEHA